ncbi:type II toxin-antitoxin system HipA family toxin [Robbsia sp. KACC 23696]|uniref:type II toxin-antitoxin system HipA family toxin n=1 Tax=Robbsia sp. KACC 23696 TaxID=3149231 RepID=UPI00325C114B
MAHELDVCLFSDRVGTLRLEDGRMRFRYLASWLTRPGAVALSASLALQEGAFDDRETRPFFAGLLPEGQMRRLIAQQFQVSGQNDFALLDRLGGECAGAVTFLPEGATPIANAREDVQWLSDEDVVAVLDDLPRRPMLAGEDGLRLSLAGAQDKLPVIFDGKRIGLPRNGTPSSHILKPAIHAVEESVINEGFCMALGARMQLHPASVRIHTVLSRTFLLVERYDRLSGPHATRQRLHQEDFCQALGIVPEMKYQNEGGPDLAACFTLLRGATRPNAPQVLRLLDYVIFNTLIGNHDAHGKNFSLLYHGNSAVLAPLYDTLSTGVYPHLTPKMAMKIGGKYKFTEVHARHWEQFAEDIGLAKALTKRRIVAMAKTLSERAHQLKNDPAHDFIDSPIVERILALIDHRCALTIRRLTDPHASAAPETLDADDMEQP